MTKPVRCTNASCSYLQEPQIADEKQQQYAPDHVVDVAAVHRDVMKGSDVVVNSQRDRTNDDCGDEEAKRGEEETFAARFGKLTAVD